MPGDPAAAGDTAGSSGSGTAGPSPGRYGRVSGSPALMLQGWAAPRPGEAGLGALGVFWAGKGEVKGWMSKCSGHVCWEHREAGGQKPVMQREGSLEQGLSRGGGAIAALCGEQQQRRRSNLAESEGPVGPFPGPGAALVLRRLLPRDSPAPPGSSHGRRSGSPCRGDGRQLIPGRGWAVLGPRSRGTVSASHMCVSACVRLFPCPGTAASLPILALLIWGAQCSYPIWHFGLLPPFHSAVTLPCGAAWAGGSVGAGGILFWAGLTSLRAGAEGLHLFG